MKKNKSKKKMTVFVFTIVLGTSAALCLSKLFCGIKTEIAEIGETKNFAEAKAFIIRDEEILTANSFNKDNLKYLYPDGEKIAKNSAFAEVYSSTEASKSSYMIDNIESELADLENLNKTRYKISKSVNGINSQINSKINELFFSINNSELSKIQNIKKDLRYLLNERQIVLGKDVDFSKKITDLQRKKASISSETPKPERVITSPESGEFIGNIDGFENRLDYKNILNTDFSDFNVDSITPEAKETSAIGKIIKSETWYAVCSVDSSMSSYIRPEMFVKVNIPSLGPEKYVDAKIESISKETENQKVNLVISCDYMDKNLAYLRKEDLKIIFDTYRGIFISNDSLHKSEKDDTKFGVYVKIGNYLKWKNVIPVFLNSDTVICKYGQDEYSNENYLQPGDNIIVGGKDLYEGKNVK